MQIDRDMIFKAKEALGDRNAELIVETLGIADYDSRNMKCCCPFHGENHASFIYNPKEYNFHCFGACGRSYDLVDVFMLSGFTYAEACRKLFELAEMPHSFGELGVKTKRQYRYPKPVECTDKSKVYEYLGKRKISPKTIDYADVRQDDAGNIVFNYYDTNDVLTMVKYRPARKVEKGENKTWCQKDADTAPLLFNMNRINTAAPLVVTEGECFPGDAEILTETGWHRFDEYNGEPVMQVDENLNGSFITPNAIVRKEYDGELYEVRRGGNYTSITTPGHNIVHYDSGRNLVKTKVAEMPRSTGNIPCCIRVDGPGIPLSDDQIALYLAVSADCTIDVRKNTRHCRFAVKKYRKYERLTGILDRLGIRYFTNPATKSGYRYVGFNTPDWIKSKLLPESWIAQATVEQREFILGEMVHWDGNHVPNRNQTEYSSKELHNCIIMQTIAHTSGHMSTIVRRTNEHGTWYRVSILYGKSSVSWQSITPQRRSYHGMVYCVSVPTGMILVRQEGHITVTGNCDCLSAIEAGFTNAVSVPLGAGNLHWIEENFDFLEQFDSIIICADNDEAGLKMQKECVYRLGSWRTKVVDIPPYYEKPDGKRVAVKDLNEVLYWFGKEKVAELLNNAKDSPVPGIVDFSDIEDIDLDALDGIPTGMPSLDRYLMKLFYGTFNIVTGINGCVSGDTEYFNGYEWKPISKYCGDKVLQYGQDGSAELVMPDIYHKYPCDHFWHFKSAYGVDQVVSDEHNLVYLTSKGNLAKKNALDFIDQYNSSKNGCQSHFITTFHYNGVGISLTDDEIRVMCAVVCDGSFTNSRKNPNLCRINIKKERKKTRLREILKRADIAYTEKHYNPHDPEYSAFYLNAPMAEKVFKPEWYQCSAHQLEVFTDEILNWDGCNSKGRRSFSTTIKENADFVQFAFSATGRRSVVRECNRIGTTRSQYVRKSIEYEVSVTDQIYPSLLNVKKRIEIPKVPSEDGYKYCFTVPSGMLVLRHNGRINITGNSGKSSFLNQILCQCLDHGESAYLYSGELPNFQSKNWLNFIFAGQRNVTEHQFGDSTYYKVTPEAKQAISNFYRGKLFIRKDGESNKKSDILKSMEEAVRKFGTKLIILDNMTSMNLENNDNNKFEKQAELVTDVINFAVKYNVAVILVVHPHKIDMMRRLNKMDVQGISALIDLAHRVISLYRVQEHEKAGEAKLSGPGWRTPPVKADVIIDILKDRLTGYEGRSVNVFYDRPSKRFFATEEELDHRYKWDRKAYQDPLPFPPTQLDDQTDEVFGKTEKEE